MSEKIGITPSALDLLLQNVKTIFFHNHGHAIFKDDNEFQATWTACREDVAVRGLNCEKRKFLSLTEAVNWVHRQD